MIRAQCIVHREGKLLMARHRMADREWWCLPGGGLEPGETPAEAALRELKEECGLDGTIQRQTACVGESALDVTYTYLVDAWGQEPRTGFDPEFGRHEQILLEVKWLPLSEIPERDRAFLWAAGLLGVKEFLREVSAWGDEISYPGAK